MTYIRSNSYRHVKELPDHAVTPKEFAAQNGHSVAYLYKLWRNRNTNRDGICFEIVIWNGKNYVISKERTTSKAAILFGLELLGEIFEVAPPNRSDAIWARIQSLREQLDPDDLKDIRFGQQ